MNGLTIQQGLRQLARTGPAPVSAVSRTCIRTLKRYRKPRPELTKFPEHHGEQIWVFNHIMTNQVVYSHTPVLRNNRALNQLPFNGKKTKPAKLRKDYWMPMALIQFEEGSGVVGQSVFQKLREFRRLHELSWGHQQNELYGMERKERHQALCDQRANSIADMAAVLGGAGAGNRILLEAGTKDSKDSKDSEDNKDGKALKVSQAKEDGSNLAPATVFWNNESDLNVARMWTKNVRHAAGLPSFKTRRAIAPEENQQQEGVPA